MTVRDPLDLPVIKILTVYNFFSGDMSNDGVSEKPYFVKL